MLLKTVQIDISPEVAFQHWPANRPLAAWWTGWKQANSDRWLLLAQPGQIRAVDSFASLVLVAQASRLRADLPSSPPSPLGPGWLVAISYDIGRELEPVAQHAPPAQDDRRWPRIIIARCDTGLVYDRQESRWYTFGDAGPLLEGLLARTSQHISPRPYTPGALASTTGRQAFIASVAQAKELIAAGDIYQANLAHRLSSSFNGSARSFFADLARIAAPKHGAYLEFDANGTRRVIACASPELLLSYDPISRRLTTKPMKGTRPGDAAREELERSSKDRAELAMITDLMRNDLGRVCELGSIRVDHERLIERHGHSPLSPGVWQAISNITGTLAPRYTFTDALRACLPGGSVTGAPKIRAMQVIDELEPIARGLYCGSIGYLADSGHAAFNVAIRTATITGKPAHEGNSRDAITNGSLDYSVGAGIVADSDPQHEWEETLVKANVLRTALGPSSFTTFEQ